jgi:Mg2+-importing ATPase
VENEKKEEYWNISNQVLLNLLNTSPKNGLSSIEANERLSKFGHNIIVNTYRKTNSSWSLFISQLKNPIIIIFLFTALLTLILKEVENASIIISIVLISSFLGFWQEKNASNAIDKLLSMIKIKSTVLRNGINEDIPIEDIVPGDIVILNSGDKVPADCKILESKDLFINESTLTGETYPTEKLDSILLSKDTPLRKRTNSLFMGTFVVSGTAIALVVHTGRNTELGKISNRLIVGQETEFQKGIKRFGYFLGEITLLLVISILVINVYFGRPVLDSFLFSLALAIGLTPQLLPAIISINLAHGAKRMAKEKVIVKRLESIENLGSMDILCTDKTGTITTGELKVHSFLDINGNNNEKVFLYAYLNAIYETGFENPIDKSIKDYKRLDISSDYSKIDEIPYDFIRKRLSIVVLHNDKSLPTNSKSKNKILITKGALLNILDICSFVELTNGKIENIYNLKDKIKDTFKELGDKGYRVIGIAYKLLKEEKNSLTQSSPSRSQSSINDSSSIQRYLINKDDESNMVFLGFILFFDPLKSEIAESLNSIQKLGVSIKIISGDNKYVAKYVAQQIELTDPTIMIGEEMHHMNSHSLTQKVKHVDIFAEIEPNQKEQIILALRKSGHVVGYMGDGINDTPALHAADASISVDTATDIVKEAADFVLLEKDLKVLAKGIQEGRRTFANTLKYIFMATSANFGNMFSMAGASLFLSFLPLLPKQILLVNLLTDIPEMAISTDNVDKEMVKKPRKWNIKFIQKFMLYFGLLSTLFDYITFIILLIILNLSTEQFRTMWFIESVISAASIVLVIRTRDKFYRKRPSKYLIIFTLAIVAIVILLPYTLIGEIFGFVSPQFMYLVIIGGIVLAYMVMAEIVKKIFYSKYQY